MPEFPGTLKPPRLATAPSSPVLGQMYFDTALSQLRWWNGSAWVAAQDVPYTLPSRLAQPPNQAPSNDLDAITETGWYTFNNTTANSPYAGSFGYVHAFAWPGVLSMRQVAYAHGNDAIWERNVGSAWQQTWPITAPASPACVLGMSNPAAVALAPATWNDMHWDVERYDPNGLHSTAAGADYYITAPVAGAYHIDVLINSNGGASQVRLIRVPGYGTVLQATGSGNEVQLSGTIYMAANDSIYVQVYNSAGSTTYYLQANGEAPHFSGMAA